jgi:tetratricopeptide (TPR) repeat protein
MIVMRCPLSVGWLAVALVGCGSPAHTPRLPAASDTVAVAARDGDEASQPKHEAPKTWPARADDARSTLGLQRARAQRRMGLDLRRQGRLEEARRALEEARELFSERGSVREQAETLNDLGEVLFQLGDFDGLDKFEWQVLELAEPAGLHSAAATAWNNLGVGFAARGLPSAALNAHDRCFALRHRLGDLSGEASALHNRGVLLLQLGRLPEGVEELRRAVSLHRRFRAKAELGQSLASLAWGLALDGQPDAALTAYDDALSVLIEAGADYDLCIALEQRAQLYRRLGRLREAREDLERSLVLAEKNGGVSRLHTAYLHLGLGAVLRDQGQTAKAVPLLRQSVEDFEALGAQEGRVMARLELARALRAGGTRAEAIAVLEAALAAVESARANLHLASLRGTYLGGWQDVYRELVDLLAEAALEAPNRGEHQMWAARAFAVSERARARALLDLLAAPSPSEGLPPRADEARRLLLRRQIEQLEAASRPPAAAPFSSIPVGRRAGTCRTARRCG